jgi:hypothetical protein
MEKSLTDVLREALIGKKIKLYKVLDKTNSTKGLEYFITQKDNLCHPKKCQIIDESYGFVKSIETELVERTDKKTFDSLESAKKIEEAAKTLSKK